MNLCIMLNAAKTHFLVHTCMSANAKTCREIHFIFPVIFNCQNNFEFLQLINVYHLLKYITVSAVDIVYFGLCGKKE